MPQITAATACNPTEDPEKVRQALLNLFPDAEIEESGGRMTARTESGEGLREAILDQHIRDTARSVMLRGAREGRTRFTLNKQTAFVGKVSFIDGPVALGGIEVIIEDGDIEGTIEHLAESTVEGLE
ncbi:MAG: hypothetical protein ISF22_11440 [Methanomassiliicoccus sp.]|nr:hypothetical protein [Methanomassiliicoccus sp.]